MRSTVEMLAIQAAKSHFRPPTDTRSFYTGPPKITVIAILPGIMNASVYL